MFMNFIGYARVSTKDQKLEPQIQKIQNYCKMKGWKVTVFSEKASAVKDRPEFERALKELEDSDGLIITTLDRLGRTVNQLSTFLYDLQDKNKHLIVIDQSIDTSTKEGKLLYNLLSSIAEFERELIYERMQAGKQFTGKYGGRPRKQLPKDAIIRHYKAGASWAFLCNTFGMSKSTLSKRLKEWGVLK